MIRSAALVFGVLFYWSALAILAGGMHLIGVGSAAMARRVAGERA